MRLVLNFVILYCIVFILGSLAVSAPFVIKVFWTYQGNSQPTVRAGFLFGDNSDSSWTFHWKWCDSLGIADAVTSCQDLRVAWLVSSLLWGVHLPLALAEIVLLWRKPTAAFWLAPIGFVFHVAGGFCYIFRVPTMFREVLQFMGPTTSVAWSLGWTGGIAIASVCVHFVVVGSFAFMFARLTPNEGFDFLQGQPSATKDSDPSQEGDEEISVVSSKRYRRRQQSPQSPRSAKEMSRRPVEPFEETPSLRQRGGKREGDRESRSSGATGTRKRREDRRSRDDPRREDYVDRRSKREY